MERLNILLRNVTSLAATFIFHHRTIRQMLIGMSDSEKTLPSTIPHCISEHDRIEHQRMTIHFDDLFNRSPPYGTNSFFSEGHIATSLRHVIQYITHHVLSLMKYTVLWLADSSRGVSSTVLRVEERDHMLVRYARIDMR